MTVSLNGIRICSRLYFLCNECIWLRRTAVDKWTEMITNPRKCYLPISCSLELWEYIIVSAASFSLSLSDRTPEMIQELFPRNVLNDKQHLFFFFLLLILCTYLHSWLALLNWTCGLILTAGAQTFCWCLHNNCSVAFQAWLHPDCSDLSIKDILFQEMEMQRQTWRQDIKVYCHQCLRCTFKYFHAHVFLYSLSWAFGSV